MLRLLSIWIAFGVAVVVAGCSAWSAPMSTDTGLRAGLERIEGGLAMVLRRGPARSPLAEVVCPGVRLVVVTDAGPAEILAPFRDVGQVGGRIVFHCAPVHPEHALSVTLQLEGNVARVEVLDEITLPTRVAELSVAYELRGSTPPDEVLQPGGPLADGLVSGDVLWRTPLAFARSGTKALALLPETNLTRILPAALRADANQDHAVLGHALMAQAIEEQSGAASCRRDPAAAPLLVGTTLRLQHELRIVTDATPRATAASIARDVFARDARHASEELQRPGDLRKRWRGLLAARPSTHLAVGRDLTLPLPAATGKDPALLRFTPRENATLVALALAHGEEPRDRDDARALLRVALAAPRRAGLSPTSVTATPTGLEWLADASGYDLTATAATRTWMLRLARQLPLDDPLAVDAVRRAAETVAFVLDSQQKDGSIPARYDSTYLAPLRATHADPAPESGAAALLLAEWASFGREPRQRSLDAAVATVEYLVREVLPRGAWQDGEVLAAGGRGDSSLALTFAALAALRIYEQRPARSVRAAVEAFLDQLSLQQQSWSPPWLAPDPRFATLRGGLGRHAGAARWSDCANTALAGWAFLIGFEHTGRVDYLQRGTLAVRAALFELEPEYGDAAPDLFGPAGTAAAIARLVRRRYGDIVVDLGTQTAATIGSLEPIQVRYEHGRIALRLACRGSEPERQRVRFFGLPADVATFPLDLGGKPHGVFRAIDLLAGVDLDATPWPDVALAPPALLQDDLPFEPRLFLRTSAPAGWSGEVGIWAEDAPHDAPPLWRARLQPPPHGGGAWRTVEPVECLALRRSATAVRVRATLLGPGDETLVVSAASPTHLGPVSEFAIAGLDATNCLVPGGSRVVPYGAQARLAREVGSGREGFVWRIALAATTGEVNLELDLSGPFRLLAGGSVLAEEAGDAPRPPRTVSVRLADRRLWESGFLDLRVEHPGGQEPLAVSVLRTRLRGVASGAPSADALVRSRQPARRLDVTVVPMSFADAPLVASRDQLQAAFFGEGYLRTPPPQARATAGSVRELVAAMSGGRTQLDGSVVEPVIAKDLLAADVAARPEALRQLVQRTLGDDAARNPGTRVWVVVHGGASLGPTDDGLITPGEPPIAVVPDLARDLSILPVGRALAMVLTARFGLQRRTTQNTGNLGALALTAHGDGHLPAGPIGLDLVALGWADLVDLAPGTSQMLVTAPVQRDRRVYRLTPSAPGRGELFLEGRGGGIGEPGLPRAGLLLYWRFAHPPLIGAGDGRTATPSLLRILRGGGAVDAAFVPGAAEDLVQRASALDDRGIPSLATPEGELFFRVTQLAPSAPTADADAGPFGMSIDDLSRRLTTVEPAFTLQRTGAPAAPFPIDGIERGLGHVVWQPRLLRFETAGHRLRASWSLPDMETRTIRLFSDAALSGRGAARVVLGCGDRTLAASLLDSNRRTVGFVVDLPRAEPQVWVEVQPDAASPRATVRIDRMVIVPLAHADHVALRQGETAVATLMDGLVHAPVMTIVAGADARAHHVEPIVLPAGRTLLRLVCGLGLEATPGTVAKVDVTLRSLDGRQWRHHVLRDHAVVRASNTQPLLVALLEIPARDSDRTGLLDVRVTAAPGTKFHLATAEVTRP